MTAGAGCSDPACPVHAARRHPEGCPGHRVAVVGAGAAGTLVAAHLVDAAARNGCRVEVTLVDPAAEVGRGVAYSTTDRRHLLNVPCGRMSAWPQDPDHFLRWLRSRAEDERPGDGAGERVEACSYVPRTAYGDYLADVLDARAATAGRQVRVHHVRARAVDLAVGPLGVALTLDGGGGPLLADAVVLALGNRPPGTGWAPEGLLGSDRFVADPWAAPIADRVTDQAPVLLVGTGLTMVDLALTLGDGGRPLTAISRHGLTPRQHRPGSRPCLPPPEGLVGPDGAAVGGLTLARLRRAMAEQLAGSLAQYGDWRPAVDGLRPVTAAIWQGLPPDERAAFLAADAAGWEVVRHRMAPEVSRELAAARASGRLRIRRGEVAEVTPRGDRLDVRLVDGSRLVVGWVVNCTGPDPDLTATDDPLLRSLVGCGLAAPGEHGWGLATDPDGRLLDAGGAGSGRLWTLGAPRKGQLWETTAIPELRLQAAALADALLAGPASSVSRQRNSGDLVQYSASIA